MQDIIKIYKKKLTELFIIAFILFSQNSYAQFPFSSENTDTVPHNRFNIGTEKNVNTFLFTGNADLLYDLSLGILRINQSYHGTAIKTSTSIFRDDENFNLEFAVPLNKSISTIFTQNWLYSSDSRNFGLNKLERLNGGLGLRYFFLPRSSLEFTAGAERNSQVGVNSVGPIFRVAGNLPDLAMEGINLQSNLNGEYMRQNYDRTNADIDFRTSVSKVYDVENFINFTGSYKLLNRDFLSPLTSDSLPSMQTEARFEDRLRGDLSVGFSLSSWFAGFVNLSINTLSVDRFFKQYIPENTSTGITRKLQELQTNFTAEGKLKFQNYYQTAGVSLNLRNEENLVQKLYNINETDFQNLRFIDNQRDNSSGRTKFYTRLNWLPFKRDTIKFDYSVWLFQYDTPSKDNNDDRDEFGTIINGIYSHSFSNQLAFSFLGELQLNHLVFLKAARSAMNNWNRVYRISPGVSYITEGFAMFPQFDLLANYTVYDFEAVSPGVTSYSFRQIGYRDSIFISLTKKFSLQTSINIRYFERGILYWNNFSESPQNSNYEQFTRVLLAKELSENIFVACGFKYYRLAQADLTGNSAAQNLNEYGQSSIGPEAVIKVKFKQGSSIVFQGWYEFQKVNNSYEHKIANFLLLTSIIF